MGVELSPWTIFDKIEKPKMAAITISPFVKNDISLKVIELETIGVKPYVSDTK